MPPAANRQASVEVDEAAPLSPEEQRLQGLAIQCDQITLSWHRYGLDLAGDEPAQVKTWRKTKAREVAIAAFGLDPARKVAPEYYRILADLNPDVAAFKSPSPDQEDIGAEITLSLAETGQGLRLLLIVLELELRHDRSELNEMLKTPVGDPGYRTGNDLAPLREHIDALEQTIADVRRRKAVSDVREKIARAEVRALAKLTAMDFTGAVACYAEAARAIAALPKECGREREDLLTRLKLSQVGLCSQAAKIKVAATDLNGANELMGFSATVLEEICLDAELGEDLKQAARAQRAQVLLARARAGFNVEPALLQIVGASTTPGAEGLVENEYRRAAGIASANYDAAIAALRALPGDHGDEVAAATAEKLNDLANLAALACDAAGELRQRRDAFGAALGLSPQDTEALLAPEHNRAGNFFVKKGIQDLRERLAALPAPARARAGELLMAYAECAVAVPGGVDGLRPTRELIHAEISAPSPELEARLLLFESKFAIQCDSATLALERLTRAAELLSRRGSSEAEKALFVEATMCKAAVLEQLSGGEDPKASQQAAQQLRAMRLEVEKRKDLLSDEQLARILLLEARACKSAGLVLYAEEAISGLSSRYRQVLKWVAAAVERFDVTHRKVNLSAAIDTLIDECMKAPVLEGMAGEYAGSMVGYALATAAGVVIVAKTAAATAAAVTTTAVAVGTSEVTVPALVGWSIIVGGAMGFAAAKYRHLAKTGGLTRVAHAYRTGMTNLGRYEKIINTVAFAVDFITALLPIKAKGFAGVRGAAVKLLFGVDLDKVGAHAIEKAALAEIEHGGASVASALTRAEAERRAATILRRFAVSARVAGPYAAAWVDIETRPMTAEQRSAERRRLVGDLIKAGLTGLATYGIVRAVNRSLPYPRGIPLELRNVVVSRVQSKPTAMILESGVFKKRVKGAALGDKMGVLALDADDLLVDDDDVVCFDPRTGQVLIDADKAALLTDAQLRQALIRELIYKHLHGLDKALRARVLAALQGDPGWQRIVMLHPPNGRSLIHFAAEILAEGFERTGESEPSELTALLRPILSKPAIAEAGFAKIAALDLDLLKLRAVGSLVIERH